MRQGEGHEANSPLLKNAEGKQAGKQRTMEAPD